MKIVYIIKVAEEQLQREITADNGIEFIVGTSSDRLPQGWTIEMIQAVAEGLTHCKDQELVDAAKKYLGKVLLQKNLLRKERNS